MKEEKDSKNPEIRAWEEAVAKYVEAKRLLAEEEEKIPKSVRKECLKCYPKAKIVEREMYDLSTRHPEWTTKKRKEIAESMMREVHKNLSEKDCEFCKKTCWYMAIAKETDGISLKKEESARLNAARAYLSAEATLTVLEGKAKIMSEQKKEYRNQYANQLLWCVTEHE